MTRVFEGDMFGFAPPLIITADEVDEIVDVFAASVAAVRTNTDQAHLSEHEGGQQ
jgi:adenosylmethionine-8-amino-7-oxononanoate aminotransferase